MASSESMEDKAFSERVKKTFGSLFASLEPSPKSLSNPLWSLTDSQVEKKEWRREIDTSRDSNPCSSSFDDFLSHARKNSRKNLQNYRKELQDDDLRDLDGDGDGDGDDEEEGENGGDKVDLNDLDVKASIGLDSTLDNEDEEDTFDKVALGRENAGDRLYMRDVTGGHDSHFSALDDLPGAVGILGNKGKDPRANRQAARIRLKEDDAEAAAQAERKPEQSPSTAERDSSVSTGGLDKLKPILKRKERESTSKPSKRVRFDPLCISNDERASENPSNKAETTVQVNGAELNQNVSRVPDHVQNPSKYTCYTLDSSEEMGNKSNTGAYLEFVEMMKAKNSVSGSDSDVPTDLPKSVTFVPKKKSYTLKSAHNDESLEKGSDAKCTPLQSTFLDMAAEDQETEAGDMDIDEPETSAESDKGIVFRKQGRQYRKPQADEPV